MGRIGSGVTGEVFQIMHKDTGFLMAAKVREGVKGGEEGGGRKEGGRREGGGEEREGGGGGGGGKGGRERAE